MSMHTPQYNATPMVEARRLVKQYPKLIAVNDVSFAVAPGEIFGLLGHNGAGKTTLIKMLTGQLAATAGLALVNGEAVTANAAHLNALFGIVFEEQNLYERLTAAENLLLTARLYRVANPAQRIAEVLAQVSLSDRARSKVATFSTGMKQRLCIARAILHHPRLLFLDEPSRGLDPAAAAHIRALVHQLSGAGTTVLLTTHDMDEADQLCHRVAFIKYGQLVALDSPYNLKLHYGQRIINAVISNDAGQRTITRFQLDQPDDTAQFSSLLAAGRVITAHSGEATLEQVFIALAGPSQEKS